MPLSDAFDEFFDKIALPTQPEERIKSAWDRLKDHIVRHAEIPPEDVFLQGSYPNGTAVRPADSSGSYDVDSCAIVAADIDDPDAAFTRLEEILCESEDYASRLDTSKVRCVRLEYTDDDYGSFHVDVVAARPHTDGHLEIPIRNAGWRETNPQGFQDWCLQQPEQFARTVRMLKRWRDETEDDDRRGIKSVVLQVLVAEALPDGETDDATALAATLANIHGRLAPYDAPPELPNPSLPDEDLTETWSNGDFQLFKNHLSDAVEIAEQALAAGSSKDAHDLWRDLLGESFPPFPDGGTSAAPPSPPAPGHAASRPRAPRDERYG